MKLRELRDRLALLPGEWDIVFSSGDDELVVLYSHAKLAQFRGQQRYVLYPFGEPEA